MIPKFRVSLKLPLALVGSAVVVAAGVGLVSYLIAADLMSAQARQNLSTIAYERANQMSALLSDIRADVIGTAGAPGTTSALTGFASAYRSMDRAADSSATAVLQEAFTAAAAPEDRVSVDKIQGIPATYGISHAMYQPTYRKLIAEHGYHDFYLFDLHGNLVYSARKADDFATNFETAEAGPFAASQLGEVYRVAAAGPDTELSFADFAAYGPAGGEALAFFATPVLDATKARVGIVALSIDETALSGLLTHRQGLGETGEAIIVGLDGLARSDSAFTEGDDLLQPTVFDDVIRTAITDGVAGDTEVSFGDRQVIAAAAPVTVTPDSRWGLVAVMDRSEVFAGVRHLLTLTLVVGGGLLAVVAVLGWLFGRSFSRPIAQITSGMNALASGDLQVQIAGADRNDEFGEMVRALEVFRANAHGITEASARELETSDRHREERETMMLTLERAFGEVVNASANGDFSRRVEANFPDAQLNTLAGSVNNLVATVDSGLAETGRVLSMLADADLTGRVGGNHGGAFARLRDDTNRVCDRLTEIAYDLRDTSRHLKEVTGEILAGANNLSSRTTKQSTAIEETSAALEQLAATVVENARRADDASSKAVLTSETAAGGRLVMDEAVVAMEGIAESSKQISNVVGLIDDIAFQTNLLALNASVEAARAGDAGKGFAVVAVEVRRLAQSAAKASADVKRLIEKSESNVVGGSRLVGEAGKKLVLMLDAAEQSSQLMQSIALANREQASAIAEVSAAMASLDEMTQHNAALVQETNAAIEQAEAQAAKLDELVDVFTTESPTAAHRAA